MEIILAFQNQKRKEKKYYGYTIWSTPNIRFSLSSNQWLVIWSVRFCLLSHWDLLVSSLNKYFMCISVSFRDDVGSQNITVLLPLLDVFLAGQLVMTLLDLSALGSRHCRVWGRIYARSFTPTSREAVSAAQTRDRRSQWSNLSLHQARPSSTALCVFDLNKCRSVFINNNLLYMKK